MWTAEATATTTARAETIWSLWSDVANWKVWDEGVTASALDGPFAVGTRGTLTTQEGQTLPFELIEVRQGQGFSDRTMLPGETRLDFIHRLERTPDGLRLTHQITLDGSLAEQFASAMGEDLRRGTEEAVRRLAHLAEEREKERNDA